MDSDTSFSGNVEKKRSMFPCVRFMQMIGILIVVGISIAVATSVTKSPRAASIGGAVCGLVFIWWLLSILVFRGSCKKPKRYS